MTIQQAEVDGCHLKVEEKEMEETPFDRQIREFMGIDVDIPSLYPQSPMIKIGEGNDMKKNEKLEIKLNGSSDYQKALNNAASTLYGNFGVGKPTTDTDTEKKAEEAEWIWIEGYKGTNEDMTCRDYQFELTKQFDMPEGAEIKECQSGFHLCLNLRDVFKHYDVENNNRFFKVHALVRKKDYEHCTGTAIGPTRSSNVYAWLADYGSRNKIVAKSIIFLKELTDEEIFEEYCKTHNELKTIPSHYISSLRKNGFNSVMYEYNVDLLIADGYTPPFAEFVVDQGGFDVAHAVASQEDLSMDMKCFAIFKKIY